jgi:protein ATS1
LFIFSLNPDDMPIYAFGSNGSGQLGIGHLEDVSVPARCLFSPDTNDDNDGENQPSQRGSREEEEGKVTRIVAGGNHTLILFNNGAVYAAGSNENGRCGQFSSPSSSGPKGGDSESSQKELSSSSSLLRFTRVVLQHEGRTIKRFRAVSATWEATFLVHTRDDTDNDEDEIFVLGAGTKGELGLGPSQIETSAGPQKMLNFPPRGTRITSMASGMGHTVVVLSNGEVYGWGAARKGQLGQQQQVLLSANSTQAQQRKFIWSPEKIEGVPFAAVGAACGREFTIITGAKERGDFVILGSDKWDIVSGASRTLKESSVSASWHGIYVHESDLSVKAWGRNDRGQLPPPDFPRVVQIAAGSEHVVALLPDQTVLAFGWGEHGNCGPETDSQGNVNGRWNKIPLEVGQDARIVGVGAGCATSWIITSLQSDKS